MKISNRFQVTILISILSILFTPISLQAGEYYRWVDADGVVHYGSTPPKGVDAELIKTYGGGSGANKAPESKNAGNNNVATSADSTTSQVALTPAQLEAKNKRCTEERERLAALSKPGRLRMNMPDGSVKYLSEEEIAREVETTRKVIQDSCE